MRKSQHDIDIDRDRDVLGAASTEVTMAFIKGPQFKTEAGELAYSKFFGAVTAALFELEKDIDSLHEMEVA